MHKENIGVKAKDSAIIPAVALGIKDRVKAVVIICHGFGEHAGNYAGLAERLAKAGYASVTPNQRGHGRLSDNAARQKKLQGIIPSYESFLDDIGDVAAYIRQRAPKAALVLYGHSMGGNLAANYLLRHDEADFACAALESPWLGLKNEVKPVTAAFARLGGKLSPKLAIINKLSVRDITGDKAKADEIRRDALYHNRISLRMFTGINNGCAYALENVAKLTIPVFVALAAREAIVSNEAIRRFIDSGGENITVKEYESSHAIHNDLKREDFYRDLIEYLDVCCA
jgi:alpha-beta hydrolase superfamily lysophospholipase